MLDLLQREYDSTLSIAKRLYEEGCLEKPNIDALVLRTLQIMMEEYASNPESLVLYFEKRK
jgi:hypothetical protein